MGTACAVGAEAVDHRLRHGAVAYVAAKHAVFLLDERRARGEGSVRMGRISPIGQRAENAYVFALNRFHERLHGGVGAALVYPVAQQYDVAVERRSTRREVVKFLVLHGQCVKNVLR